MKKLFAITCLLVAIASISVCKIIYNIEYIKPTLSKAIPIPDKRLALRPEYTVMIFERAIRAELYDKAWEKLTGKIIEYYNNDIKEFTDFYQKNPKRKGEEIPYEPTIKRVTPSRVKYFYYLPQISVDIRKSGIYRVYDMKKISGKWMINDRYDWDGQYDGDPNKVLIDE